MKIAIAGVKGRVTARNSTFTSIAVNALLTHCRVWACVTHNGRPKTRRPLAEHSPALFVSFESPQQSEASFLQAVTKSSGCRLTGSFGTFCYTIMGRYSGARQETNKIKQTKKNRTQHFFFYLSVYFLCYIFIF